MAKCVTGVCMAICVTRGTWLGGWRESAWLGVSRESAWLGV